MIKLPSADLKSQLNCVYWQPEQSKQTKGIVQLIHGMAEYIERYEEFADFLTKAGYLVIGHDHLGHGKTTSKDSSLLGYFGKENSVDVLINDTYTITTYAKQKFPDLDYFILGHSMGSFILRNYLKQYSHEMNGAIIMGTGGYRKELNIALPLLKTLNKKAPEKVNYLIDKIAFGNFAKRFPDRGSGFTWLSKNQSNVRSYEEDPLLGFVFTNNGFYTLFSLMASATEPYWYSDISKELPMLIISGSQDPVGDFGKAPREMAVTLADEGFKDVTLQLYPSLRHEILNETEQELVMLDIQHWLDVH